MRLPKLLEQEVPPDHPDSVHFFKPGPDKPFVATPTAIDMYNRETIMACLNLLRAKADREGGLDYVQVFADPTKREELWIIDDGPGGAITALLGSER